MARWIPLVLIVALGAPERARADDEAGAKKAVAAALDWLARHQSKTGAWEPNNWTGTCTKGQCRGPGTAYGQKHYAAGITGLALQAFVAGGHTDKAGKHRAVIAKAVAYLRKQQRADGSIAVSYGHGETVYNHALATLGLAELYAKTKDEALKLTVQKALVWIGKAQNPNLGWKYGSRSGRNDTSVTGWMTQALAAGARAGLFVLPTAFTGAQRWFKRATASSGAAGYETPGGGSAFLRGNDRKYDKDPAMTAMSVFCRILSGERRSEDTIRKGANLIDASPPLWTPRKVNAYYWLSGTRALASFGGDKRKSWNTALRTALLPSQRTGGCEDGSWDPIGQWCLAGGRLYFAAINALALQASLDPPLPQVSISGTPHGGKIEIKSDVLFEALLLSGRVVVYLTDIMGAPVPLAKVEGTVQVRIYPVVRGKYKPLYKARRRKRLTAKQMAKEAARRRKWEAKMREKRKPKVLEVDLTRVPPDPTAGRLLGHLEGKVKAGSRYDRVGVTFELKNVPGLKAGRAGKVRVSFSFRSLSKQRSYMCQTCKVKHEDPGKCVTCGKTVK